MNQTYEWLYDYYAEPLLRKLTVFDEDLLEQLAKAAPEMKPLDLQDRLIDLRMDWCTAAFTAGVQLGMGLLAPQEWQTAQIDCFWENYRSK